MLPLRMWRMLTFRGEILYCGRPNYKLRLRLSCMHTNGARSPQLGIHGKCVCSFGGNGKNILKWTVAFIWNVIKVGHVNKCVDLLLHLCFILQLFCMQCINEEVRYRFVLISFFRLWFKKTPTDLLCQI